LTASPVLQEPYFLCEITAPVDAMGGVYSTLTQRRGMVIEEISMPGNPLNIVKAHLPVSESFGFVAAIRGNT